MAGGLNTPTSAQSQHFQFPCKPHCRNDLLQSAFVPHGGLRVPIGHNGIGVGQMASFLQFFESKKLKQAAAAARAIRQGLDLSGRWPVTAFDFTITHPKFRLT